MALLGNIFAAQDVVNGHPDNFTIKKEGHMIDVPDIELEFARPADGVASVDLGPAGDAGGDEMAPTLGFIIEGEVLDEEGARADEAHVAFEDVDELGKFVDGGGAYEFADGGEALGVRKEVAVRIFAVVHGFEFDDLKDFFMLAGSRLGEEDASPIGNGQ